MSDIIANIIMNINFDVAVEPGKIICTLTDITKRFGNLTILDHANAEINRNELKQRVRELRVMRRLAKLDQPALETDISALPKVKPLEPKPAPKPQIQVPVILVPPAAPSQQ